MVEKLKGKFVKCYKDMGGEGEMITCDYKHKASSVHLHPSTVITQGLKCDKGRYGDSKECSLKNFSKFSPGDHWSYDFNYCEMLEYGKNAKISDGLKKLNLLFDSFEDVNYHKESEPLSEAINYLKKKNKKLAEEKLKEFNKLSDEFSKETCD